MAYVTKATPKEAKYIKKGRNWTARLQMVDADGKPGSVDFWDYIKKEVKLALEIQETATHKKKLLEAGGLKRRKIIALIKQNKQQFPDDYDVHIAVPEIKEGSLYETQDDIDFWTKVVLGEMGTETGIENCDYTIKCQKKIQRFYTYMYNEEPIETIKKTYTKIMKQVEEQAELVFEDKEKDVTYWFCGNTKGKSTKEQSGDGGYLTFMNRLQDNRKEYETLFKIYIQGVQTTKL